MKFTYALNNSKNNSKGASVVHACVHTCVCVCVCVCVCACVLYFCCIGYDLIMYALDTTMLHTYAHITWLYLNAAKIKWMA